MSPPHPPIASRRPKLVTALIETFGFSPLLASLTALFLLSLAAAALLWVWLSAPPRSITITSGPPGSSFQSNAEAYQTALAERGITLHIVPSGGSLDNLQRLEAKDSGVDLGFVQGGIVGDDPPPGLVSLGTISNQPVWIFYRGATRIARLSELAGQRIGIGAAGSGVQSLAKTLLGANGITGAPSTLVEQSTEAAAKAFQAGQLDAVFMMGDSAPLQTLRTFIRSPAIQAFSFTQADAYLRKFATLHLNKIVVPQGGFDLGQNLPAQDLTLIGPGVELIARRGLNSAISDMVLDAAQEVHARRTSILARKGEFPAPLDHGFPLSADAVRFYKSGKGFMYDWVHSFWLANLVNRLLVAVVPFLLILIPAVRLLPVVYRWSVQLRIYRCYRPLLRVERDAGTTLTAARAAELLERLQAIEAEVNALKVPASFASQFYDLRHHVVFVRNRLKAAV
jgi:hypothetical protein